MSAMTQRALDSRPSVEVIRGTIGTVRFYNPKSGWAVLSVHASGESVTVVGPCVNPREGDEYQFTGSFVTDPKYGRQFKFDSAEVLLPSTRKGVIRYLASIAYGVGEVKAARIVGVLGDDCLTRIATDAEALEICTFLSGLQRQEIVSALTKNRTLADLCGLVCREGITPAFAARILAYFGDDAMDIVKAEPYRLTEIDGIGFLTADKVAMAVGIKPDAPARVQAAVRHILSEAENEGHCSLRPNDLVKEVPALLGTDVGVPAIAKAVQTLIDVGMLIRDGDDIYLTELHEAECKVAEWAKAMALEKPEGIPNLEGYIAACESNAGITYHDKQREAIRMALASGFSVLTGGPGTGKSLITRAIVDIYKREHRALPVYLCSPTGRAAKRLSEATGHEAKTIHRLLGYIPGVGFSRHEEEPLDGGLLLADEASMMDVRLARSLFAACANGMQVVLIGDVDQLPSVGPGSVLRDIIDSGAVPVTRLEYVYRQEEGSGISALAHAVNAGTLPDLSSLSDITAIQVQNPDEVLPLAARYAKKAYEQYGLLGFNVLAPGHRGSAGVRALNEAIRAALNRGAKGSRFAPGDKCMVIRNSYQFDVFNGDLGIVRSIGDGDSSIVVDFGDKVVEFGPDEEQAPLDILQLAFASTIHKAQGGQSPVVVVVLTRQHFIMLKRQLIYTAITRAMKRLVLIYQPDALKKAARDNQTARRNSRLATRLKGETRDA